MLQIFTVMSLDELNSFQPSCEIFSLLTVFKSRKAKLQKLFFLGLIPFND